jgi:hypothetical protein
MSVYLCWLMLYNKANSWWRSKIFQCFFNLTILLVTLWLKNHWILLTCDLRLELNQYRNLAIACNMAFDGFTFYYRVTFLDTQFVRRNYRVLRQIFWNRALANIWLKFIAFWSVVNEKGFNNFKASIVHLVKIDGI